MTIDVVQAKEQLLLNARQKFKDFLVDFSIFLKYIIILSYNNNNNNNFYGLSLFYLLLLF
jgi:hypothetical protein